MVYPPELVAPAGDWECLRAAVANGADAVYFGLPRFNARLRADNFAEADLPEVIAFCHARNVRAYVTLNTLIFTEELEAAADCLRLLNRCGVDGVLVQDVGLARLARAVAPDLPLHASTQMTITSPEGVAFARELGITRVVVARELSLHDIRRFDRDTPLEVFVHGALCVAYSGQCLTSEALGQRSANRGECAQACRLPYELIVDGTPREMGDRRYLLSPQDLAGVNEIGALLELGVTAFKIEGRLKSPEYVAAVTGVYRKAIDTALQGRVFHAGADDWYQLEMTFSRGFFTGWLHGVDHQRLVAARFGKKRGPLAGRVRRVGSQFVEFTPQTVLRPGDGVVFDSGEDPEQEQGGRIYRIAGERFFFAPGHIDFRRIKCGDRVWKTSDPTLSRLLRASYARVVPARHKTALTLRVTGCAGSPLRVACNGVEVESALPLEPARTVHLTTARLAEHLGRFGVESRYTLAGLDNQVHGRVLLPIAELNRLRRELVAKLDAPAPARANPPVGLADLLAPLKRERHATTGTSTPRLHVLCRTMEQLAAALACGVTSLYLDFEDVRRYREAVAVVRQQTGVRVFVATPRIQKPGEHGFFHLIEKAAPDGVLVRSLGAVLHFAGSGLECVGDFSLNVANPLAAQHFIEKGLHRVTVACDLNAGEAIALLESAPAHWFELVLYQHLPMFHMEHCVFAAFLSNGHDHTDCGRPCDRHRVHLRDRTGRDHPLHADAGCRNTLFNAIPQTGAEFFRPLRASGLAHFRVELLGESAGATRRIVRAFQALLTGGADGATLWRQLRARSRLGVTRGTLCMAESRLPWKAHVAPSDRGL